MRLVSVRLVRFMECSGVLPTTQFAYRKSLGICAALLSVSIHWTHIGPVVVPPVHLGVFSILDPKLIG